MQRERNPVDEQKIRAPFQNSIFNEEGEEEIQELEEDIHCVEDEDEESFLTEADYEGSLFDQQLNQLYEDQCILQVDEQTGYNLRSKKNPGKQSTLAPPKKVVAPVKQQVKDVQKAPQSQQMVRAHPSKPEKVSSSFNLETEIQKLKIPVPLVELMKNEAF